MADDRLPWEYPWGGAKEGEPECIPWYCPRTCACYYWCALARRRRYLGLPPPRERPPLYGPRPRSTETGCSVRPGTTQGKENDDDRCKP